MLKQQTCIAKHYFISDHINRKSPCILNEHLRNEKWKEKLGTHIDSSELTHIKRYLEATAVVEV